MKTFELQYKNLLKKTLKNGELKKNRTGVNTYSIFSENIKIDISSYFPILTGKKIFENTFKTEFEWFINGGTNTDIFKKNNVKIWDKWADKDGNLGKVYGYQMINFNSSGYNQLNELINNIKNDKFSRRHIISLWNPIELNEMALPPCYLYFQFYINNNNEINLYVVQRSADLFAGVPYDICLFSLFLLYVAEKTGLKAKEISYNIVDAHIYTNHLNGVNEYLSNIIYKHPKYIYKNSELTIKNYKSNNFIKIEIAK